jgi:hypothetical protein
MRSDITDKTLHHAYNLAAAACALVEFSAGLMRLVTVQAQNNHDLASGFSATIASILPNAERVGSSAGNNDLAEYQGALELIKVIAHTISSTTLNMRSIAGHSAFLEDVVGSKMDGSSLVTLGEKLSTVLTELRQLDDARCGREMALIRTRAEQLLVEHQANQDASVAAVRSSEKLLGTTLHVWRALEQCIADADAR